VPESLWTVNQAAQHWDVSTSRARAILAGRQIRRVSGYPADQVKAVRLRQGARTDLLRSVDLNEQRQEALNIVDVAAAMRGATERVRLRMFFEFMRGADEVGREAVSLGSQCFWPITPG
jgi:hypothetical protein